MTAHGYCCCYLGHCSKANHIAIKGVIQRAKYENVLDLWIIKGARSRYFGQFQEISALIKLVTQLAKISK